MRIRFREDESDMSAESPNSFALESDLGKWHRFGLAVLRNVRLVYYWAPGL